MIANSAMSSRASWLPVAVLMLLLFVTECFGDAGRAALQFDRQLIAQGEVWRLLTGNFVHLGWWHWFLNEMGLIILWMLCPEPVKIRFWVTRLVLIGVFMSTCIYYFVPQLHTYVGLSAVQHGLFFLGLSRQSLQKDLIALGCLAYLLGKIGLEQIVGAPVSDESAIGGHVATESHFYGTIGAFIYGFIFRSYWGKELVQSHTDQNNIDAPDSTKD